MLFWGLGGVFAGCLLMGDDDDDDGMVCFGVGVCLLVYVFTFRELAWQV